jgi:cytoskeletal protein RodZ
MDDLGLRLKQARESRGVALRTIATKTKISVAALEALERNDFSRLPGGIFGRAFVRAYALEIGLDPETTVSDFQTHLDRSEREAAERNQIRVDISQDDREFLARQQRAVRWLRVVAIVVAIAAVTFLAWQAKSLWKRFGRGASSSAVSSQQAPAVPDSAAELAGAPIPVPAAPEVAASVSSPAQAAAPAVALAGASAPLVVEFALTADCWVVASVDGGRSMSQLLKAGDSRRFDASREVFLDVGNAGAIQLTINGTAARPLGPAGSHVQKTIRTDNLSSFLP